MDAYQISNNVYKYKQLIIGMRGMLKHKHSQTCFKRSTLGQRKLVF
jgi:hypothetical protein